MKKLVFTALAVVSFSATSFAGTKEVKESQVVVLGDSCESVCHLAYNLAIKEGASHEAADKFADLAYGNCKASQKGLEECAGQ